MDADSAKFINRAHSAIMGAARRGALSPGRARHWAVEIGEGRAFPEQVDQLAAAPGDQVRREVAAQQGDLGAEVMDILVELRDAVDRLAGPQAGPAPPGFSQLFPDYARAAGNVGWPPIEPPNTLTGRGHTPMVRPSLVYPGEQQGQKNRQPVEWDGYTAAASAGDGDEWSFSDEDLYRQIFGPGTFGGDGLSG